MSKASDRPKYTLSFRPTYDGADDEAVMRAIRWLIKTAGRKFDLKFTEINIERTEDEISR